MSQTEYNINLTEEEILQNLRQFITGNHADLVSEAILGLIDSTTDRTLLFKATLGIKFKHKYKVGDRVSVKEGELYAWSWNKEEMTNKGLLRNGRVEAVVSKILHWRDDHYEVKHYYIEEKTTVVKHTKHATSENGMSIQEQWPE